MSDPHYRVLLHIQLRNPNLSPKLYHTTMQIFTVNVLKYQTEVGKKEGGEQVEVSAC